MDVVRWLTQLLEIRTYRLGRDARLTERRNRRRAGALGELLPVRAEQQTVMDVLRRFEAERARKLSLELGVRAVVGAANDVRDLEIVVVDDARQVVGGAAVGTEQRRPSEPDRALLVLLPHARAASR